MKQFFKTQIHKVILSFLIINLLFFNQKIVAQDATISWDTWGVPHIKGQNLEEAYYTLGWSQMKAHANLILKLYGKARGKSAEYWGGGQNLQSDIKVWQLDIPTRAKIWFAQQKTLNKKQITAFVKGMNAYAKKYPETIEANNQVVLPLQNTDVLAHLQLSYHFMVGAFAMNQQSAQWKNAGSNAWAIAPKKSESGNTLLLIQPHPPWIDSFKFFEAHIQITDQDLNLYGITQVGSPSIAMGFNENLGWGMTFNQADSFDLIELETQNNQYKIKGNWKDFERKKVILKIKKENTYEEKVIYTQKSDFGWIVSEKNNKALALRLSGLDRPFMMEEFFEMGKAKNVQEFEKALAKLQLPLQNIIVGDKKGNIAYVYNGLIPVRKTGNLGEWSQIIPANKESALVENYHVYQDLPKVVNPQGGFVLNSNNSPWTSTYPSELKAEDYPAYFAFQNFDLRSRNSLKMLLSEEKHSFEDLVKYQASSHAELADLVLKSLVNDASNSNDNLLKEAGQVLKNWDKKLDKNSKGAVLFVTWYFKVRKSGLFPKDFALKNMAINNIELNKEAKSQLKTACEEVKQKYGKLEVAFGEVYKIQNGNNLLSGGLGLNEVGSFSAGFYRPAPNNQWVLLGGTTFSSVVEFGEKVKAKGLLSYGNFTEKSQFSAKTQLELLINRELREIYFYEDDIKQNTVEKEVLIVK